MLAPRKDVRRLPSNLSLRWDVESTCPACGFALAVCGGDLPEELRGRLLSEYGRARLRVAPLTRNAAIMRVLRAELGIGLDGVRAVLEQVLTGQYSGTLPEMELLARKLRASGIEAAASRTVDWVSLPGGTMGSAGRRGHQQVWQHTVLDGPVHERVEVVDDLDGLLVPLVACSGRKLCRWHWPQPSPGTALHPALRVRGLQARSAVESGPSAQHVRCLAELPCPAAAELSGTLLWPRSPAPSATRTPPTSAASSAAA